MSDFTDFFPSSGGGGGGGGGLLNQQVFKSSGTFNPSANGVSDGDLIHFTMIGGGGGGWYGGSQFQNIGGGGRGGRIWNGTIAVTTAATAISITVGAGGPAQTQYYNGGNSTAIGGGGISISTASSDARSFDGGKPGTQAMNSSAQGGTSAGQMALPPFSAGGNVSDSGPVKRGANTGDGGGSFSSSTGGVGESGIVIISW
jgi:hypothetical protein|tara:strand:- start:1169 stop:1771 length:603 start_codon:yes stop_codon:yes gene_type:complete